MARNAGPLAQRVDAALPQTQCRQCGHDGCAPYADAVAGGEAINRCPPGGDSAIAALALLTGRPRVPLDRAFGDHRPLAVARVDESWCIGCTLCIDACPVDAIVGAAKRMHTVLPSLCTGCELCLPPCPVDCIVMVPAGRAWSPEDARAARLRFDARGRRLAREHRSAGKPAPDTRPAGTSTGPASAKADAIAAALERARARRAATGAKSRSN
jgi:Na+-translocating ferredoxin:NAD+ oxidoreductase subunit B